MNDVVPFDRVLRRTQRPWLDRAPAAPFIKWAGGKRALIPDIARRFPDRIGTYWEPFVGGGAVFFTMADRIDRAILSDLNEELVIAWQVVKARVDELVEALRGHESAHRRDEGHYLRVRGQDPDDAVAIAARFIYLNKTCYNGLYRVNKAGRFNVPKGRYANPDICNEGRLRRASAALARATIRIGDFEKVVRPGPDDFIYCDPPYDDCFTGYQPGGFTAEDQERLRNTIQGWVGAGAQVMMSNSDTPLIRRLYRGGGGRFFLHEAEAPRLISSRAAGRGAVAELIVTTYG